MKKSFLFTGFLIVLLGASQVGRLGDAGLKAYAHSGAKGVVKERMDGMKAIAAATKSIAKLDWTKRSAAREQLRQSAGTLALHASQIIALFPEGSIKGPSEATPAIWERPDVFAALAKKLEAASNELVELSSSATSKDSIAPAFGKVASTCKACHSGFRVKK